MKKLSFAAALTVLALLAAPLAAASSTWTGWITDDHCGAKGAKAGHKGCAEKCLGSGAKLVFYDTTSQKLLGLDKQDLAKEHLEHLVVVTGELKGEEIVVESIRAKGSPPRPRRRSSRDSAGSVFLSPVLEARQAHRGQLLALELGVHGLDLLAQRREAGLDRFEVLGE